ncbi:MAG: polysaccharide pyruvyl transferase family protein [Paraglaciecola sp.]|nr:polysaccharide pyruvyl transferase family protein [Paraglaciecola sp.]NCT48867.1 polysaccharide pyruvyl transferase family protein [Paraglaciecola sp.]
MELGYFKGNINNVGDDLNYFLWTRLLGDKLTPNQDSVFIGIGSVLDGRFDKYAKKVVFGTGARGAHLLPTIDTSWNIRFVRGPLTCEALAAKGQVSKYITDPAILAAKYFKQVDKPQKLGLIPYFRTDHGHWQNVADALGAELISPTLSVEAFTEKLAQCKLVLTEAMHGAIIADSMRIPWIPYSSFTLAHEQSTHVFKWTDWCRSMELEFVDTKLPILWPNNKFPLLSGLARIAKQKYIVHTLKKLVDQGKTYLSKDSVFTNKLAEVEKELDMIE